MVGITFEYKDSYSHGGWRKRSCTVRSLEECKRIYGLEDGDVEYHILSVVPVERAEA